MPGVAIGITFDNQNLAALIKGRKKRQKDLQRAAKNPRGGSHPRCIQLSILSFDFVENH
jgi:hypothetical protein